MITAAEVLHSKLLVLYRDSIYLQRYCIPLVLPVSLIFSYHLVPFDHPCYSNWMYIIHRQLVDLSMPWWSLIPPSSLGSKGTHKFPSHSIMFGFVCFLVCFSLYPQLSFSRLNDILEGALGHFFRPGLQSKPRPLHLSLSRLVAEKKSLPLLSHWFPQLSASFNRLDPAIVIV